MTFNLQSRRGAARKAAKSPTVRRAEWAAVQGGPGAATPPSSSSNGGRTGTKINPKTVFPDDLAILVPVLKSGANLVKRHTEQLGSAFSPAECLEILAAARRVMADGMVESEAELERKYNLTPYKIHTVAGLLLVGDKPSVDVDAGKILAGKVIPLIMVLWHLAATSGTWHFRPHPPGGYLPSVLSMLNVFGARKTMAAAIRADSLRMHQSHPYRTAEKLFLAYLAAEQQKTAADATDTGSNLALRADAFTLAGVFAEQADDPVRALRWYRAARCVGEGIKVEFSPLNVKPEGVPADANMDLFARKPRWEWERHCLTAIGRLQAQAAASTQASAAPTQRTSRVDVPDQATRTQSLEYKQAKAAVLTAALALRCSEAALLLATEYDDGINEDSGAPFTEEERQTLLESLLLLAAAGGRPEAAEVLAEREDGKTVLATLAELNEEQKGGKGETASKTKEGKGHHQMLAEEWRRLAAAAVAADLST